MNLKHLSDEAVHQSTEAAAKAERAATTVLLQHLCEVQRRRLYAQHGCDSLFSYCVQILHMSEPQASRRINAARALADFPELEEKINSGSKAAKPSRYIPSTMRHHVWMRDSGCCTFVDPRTGKRCGSRHRVQLDHAAPFAKGGEHTVENLRLRCLAHNQLHAIQSYGRRVTRYMAIQR